MVIEVNGSLFDNLPAYSVIMHQTNCLGTAGAGVALQVSKRFPGWFQDYHSYCMWFKDKPDELLGTFHRFNVDDKKIICSAFAQVGISKAVQMTDYDAWEKILRNIERQTKIVKQVTGKTWTVHVPYNIGCGLGGGEWEKMLELFNQRFGGSSAQLFIHKM